MKPHIKLKNGLCICTSETQPFRGISVYIKKAYNAWVWGNDL